MVIAALRVAENEYICHRRDNTFGRIVTGLTPLVRALLSLIGIKTPKKRNLSRGRREEGEKESLLGRATASRSARGPANTREGKELPPTFERLTGGEEDDVDPFQGILPDEFLAMCKGNEHKARKAYARTLLWREGKQS